MSLRTILRIAIGFVTVLCCWLLFLAWFGYGHVQLTIPDNAQVWINGHKVSSGTLRLRSGSYTLTATSPRYYAVHETIHVPLLGTISPAVETQKRTANSIVASAIGVYGSYGKPQTSDTQFFQDNTWMTTNVGPGAPAIMALHYQNSMWGVVYNSGSGNTDTSALPAAVLTSVNNLLNEAFSVNEYQP